MKKYVWSYNSSNVSIREPTVDLLCETINTFEKLNENDKISKWLVYNYIQKKIKKPRELVLRISRRLV